MPTHKLLAGLLLFLSLLAGACQGKDNTEPTPVALPATLIGSWQVAEVLVDQGKESNWNQTRDDPYNIHRFLGRVITISPQRITFEGYYIKLCAKPTIIVHRTTLANVIATSMSSRHYYADTPPATPKDFRLPLAVDAPIELLSLQCGEEASRNTGGYIRGLGNTKEDTGIRGPWFTFLKPGQLMLRWEDETFLILKRLTGNETPVASFDCNKAATTVEKTICGSVSLAAFDQSVTQTYKQSQAYYQTKDDTKEAIAELKKSQKLWIKQRNTCGSDAACLEKSMSERLSSMEDDIGTYAYEHR